MADLKTLCGRAKLGVEIRSVWFTYLWVVWNEGMDSV